MNNITWFHITPKECLLLKHLTLFSGSFYFKDVLSSYMAVEHNDTKVFDMLYALFKDGLVNITKASQQLEERMFELTSKAALALTHCTHLLALPPKQHPFWV